MKQPAKGIFVTQKKRGRPKVTGNTLYVSFRLREGRSEAEDQLLEKLSQLPERQRSEFIRRVLTTGDIEPLLSREFAKESERVASALGGLASFWDDADDD